ncbi:MAG: substrate-binding domain-containing protein [Clostridia bacterium]|nr:substrate-binding domain-containing protein [Clostridia bacterium]
MSSLRSRLILKCWSLYNSCKTRASNEKVSRTVKIVLTVPVALLGVALLYVGIVTQEEYDPVGFFTFMSFLLLPVPLLLGMVWLKKLRKVAAGILVGFVALIFVIRGGTMLLDGPQDDTVIDVTPNINTQEYLPFKWPSKIVKLKDASLRFTRKDDLPVIDGATAAFPVYSAFVHAVYPRSTELYDGVFEYNNTVGGYEKLAERKTDIFFGAYPSKEQLAYAEECGTAFEFTQVASEAFVFIVHKDNPIDSLTVEQIRGIYAGRITNWKEVGGNDEPIMAYQRDKGSGSQSMLLRFMGDIPVMDAPTTEVSGMGSLLDVVADYESRPGSIGFSFRFYVEGIIKNPDIKMIAIDGVAPNVENIKNGTYPVVAPVYAVTWAGNENPNVTRLIEWVLSEEGQYIIEETGYVGLGK